MVRDVALVDVFQCFLTYSKAHPKKNLTAPSLYSVILISLWSQTSLYIEREINFFTQPRICFLYENKGDQEFKYTEFTRNLTLYFFDKINSPYPHN